MKILVTGTKGQISRCLQERARSRVGVELVAVGRPELDLMKPEAVGEVIGSEKPDIVVSAAAYTSVDQAEEEPETAFAVNGAGAGAVAAAAREIGAPVIHLSTDYVFSGEVDRPYREDDAPDPQCVYGASKLAGERAVAASNDRHVILRTAWVHSPYGQNFVTSILKLAETQDEISVVDDQWGNPTSAFDLADSILCISERLLASEESSHFGIFHLTGEGSTTWSGFAEKIMELSKARGEPHAAIKPVPSSAYPTKAKRPVNSCLGTNKFDYTYGWKQKCWSIALREAPFRK